MTTSDDLLTKVDHLVYGVPDLQAAVEQLETLLGVQATPGGSHPGRGTRNALIALGPASYIEVIGPDPEQPQPAAPRSFGLDQLTSARLVTWAAKASNLEQLHASAAEQSVLLGELASGSRQRPDGVLLQWRSTSSRTVVADGIVPFFIDWGTTPHPARTAVEGVTLVGLRAEHSDAERLQTMLSGLGLPMPVQAAPEPALVATLNTPNGVVELR